MDPIRAFIEQLLNKDWKPFNELNMMEQGKEWRSIFESFEVVVRGMNLTAPSDFESVRKFIFSYADDLRRLPFRGKIYVVVNPLFLHSGLTEVVNRLDFEEQIKGSKHSCGCEIRLKLKLKPDIDHLKEFGTKTDGYYDYRLYTCNICGVKWMSHTVDDSRGDTAYEKLDESL